MSPDIFPSQPETSPSYDDVTDTDSSYAPLAPSQPRPPRRILVVESEVESADKLVHVMEGMGFIAEIASDAKTAMLYLTEFKPHLVLLGTYLADMPGYELTAILKGAPQYSGSLVAVGLLFIADRAKLLKHRLVGAPEVPMSQYIFKPINEVEVRGKVQKELDRAMAIRYAHK